jgi:hypothetical protein
MNDTGEVLIYQTEDGKAALEVRLDHETVRLDAHQLALLKDSQSMKKGSASKKKNYPTCAGL